MSAIESMIPEYLRDLSGSLARLEVAFKDANTSLEGSSSSLNQAAALVRRQFDFCLNLPIFLCINVSS